MVQMGKLVNHCDMELMKMAMLRHEETFRQQVHELHRLYRVQRQLMSGLSRPSELSRRRQIRRKQPRRALDLHLPADEYIVVRADRATPPSRRDGLELTLAVGSGGGGSASRRKRRDEGMGTPLGSESDCSGGNLTSSSTTDTSRSRPYQGAMPPFLLQEGAAPWLVQCLGLRMA